MKGLDTPSGRKRDKSEVSRAIEMFSKMPKQEKDQELEDELAQLKLGKTPPDWAQELFGHVKTLTRILHSRLYSKVSSVVSQCATNTIIISQLQETNSHLQARVENRKIKRDIVTPGGGEADNELMRHHGKPENKFKYMFNIS